MGRCPLANPQNRIYVWIMTEKGLKMCIYGSPKYIYINKFAMSVCLAMRSAVLGPTELKLGTGVGFGELRGPDRSKVI